jgi:dienelactone hydrolase
MIKIFITLCLLVANTICFSQLSNLTIKADVVYAKKYGMALTFDVFIPVNSNGAAVLFMNSGGFESGRLRYLKMDESLNCTFLKKDELMIVPENFKYPPLAQFGIDELLEKGFTVFDVRHGSSPKFTLDEIVKDCEQAIEFIKKHAGLYNVDPERLGLFGASAGGYIASYLATTGAGVKSVALYYPAGFDWIRVKYNSPDAYNNLPALHLDEEVLDSLSIKRYISSDDPSFLIIYGKEDFPFIIQASEDIAAGLKNAGVEIQLISIPGTGHEFRGTEGYHTENGEFARLKMVEWFEKQLNE